MTTDSEQSWGVLNALLKIETAAELTAIMAETDAGKAASAIAVAAARAGGQDARRRRQRRSQKCRADVPAHPGCLGCLAAARRRGLVLVDLILPAIVGRVR